MLLVYNSLRWGLAMLHTWCKSLYLCILYKIPNNFCMIKLINQRMSLIHKYKISLGLRRRILYHIRMCRVRLAQQMAHISYSLSVHQHMLDSLDHKTHIGLLKWIDFMHIKDKYLQHYIKFLSVYLMHSKQAHFQFKCHLYFFLLIIYFQ